MDRKQLIGFVLIGVLLMMMQMVNQEPEVPEQTTTEQISGTDPTSSGTSGSQVAGSGELAATSSAPIKVAESNPTVKASFPNSESPESFTTLENDKVILTFSNKGGRIYRAEIKDFKTADGEPVVILDGPENRFNYELNINNLPFSSQDMSFSIAEQTNNKIVYRLTNSDGAYMEQNYTLKPDDDYMVDYDFKMVGFENALPHGTILRLDWQHDLIQQEKHTKNERDKSSIYYSEVEEIEYLNEMSDDLEEETNVSGLDWVAFKQQFFNYTLLSQKQFKAHRLSAVAPTSEEDETLKTLRADIGINYERTSEFVYPFQLYIGPNHYKTLKAKEVGLDRIVYLGWGIFRWVNKGVIIPIFNVLNKYIGSYGLIILILTLLIKTALFPLTRKSYMSFAKMNVLKPEIEELKEKFGKEPQRLQQEQMKLYGKAGVNPIGGCLPQLLQFPILIAMYNFFPSALELRQQGFLWATDLSTYDSIASLPFEIPFYGSHVSLFTLLSAASSLAFMKINASMTPSTGAAASQMKIMQYVMPVFLVFIFNSFSAALTFYFFLSNVISFVQQWVIKKFFIDEDKIRAEMKAKQQKPSKKKGGFQKKLEEMLKEQEKKQKARQNQAGKGNKKTRRK